MASVASKRYSHRENCTLLFDKHPLFVVEQVNEDSRGTLYLVGDNLSLFTIDTKPTLEEGSILRLLGELQQEKLEKLKTSCLRAPSYSGLEYL